MTKRCAWRGNKQYRWVARDGESDDDAIARIEAGFRQAENLEKWRSYYPSISALLNDCQCPDVLNLMAGTSENAKVFHGWVVQWIKDGRPEIPWPEIVKAAPVTE